MTLDIYHCTHCPEEFAVKEGKEPEVCPFYRGEVSFSHSTED